MWKRDILLIAALDEMADPVLCNGGAAVCDEEDFHNYVRWIIRHCPMDSAELWPSVIFRIWRSGNPMSKGRILIVEDNMDNYELVRFMLERAGYDVFLAVNGRDGVDCSPFAEARSDPDGFGHA